jgi:GTPase involved in cell partitioning and DNA repair
VFGNNGGNGQGKGLLGARGKDKIVDVPAGTIIHMPEDSGLADIDLEMNGEAVVALGGQPGKVYGIGDSNHHHHHHHHHTTTVEMINIFESSWFHRSSS